MRFVDRTRPYRKSGGIGHPGICCTFCRGQEMPLFISRGSATPVDDFTESRIRGPVYGSAAGNPGTRRSS